MSGNSLGLTQQEMEEWAEDRKQEEDKVMNEARQTVVVGDNPILRDVAQAHDALLQIRSAVASAVLTMNPNPDTVMGFSIVSTGAMIEDQMIVFSPGGEGLRNANAAVVRLKAATRQMERLIKKGAFN